MSISRRRFLKTAGLLGITPALLRARALGAAENHEDKKIRYEQNDPENTIYTVCLGCNTGCGLKVKIQDGTIVKTDGNPYTPWNRMPHLSYKTPVQEAARIDGALCPKGQAGLETAYDPYRIRKVLKRDGPRGSMKWKTMDFHAAVDEIVKGGKLFSHVPGEENRVVEGYESLYVLKDPKLAKEMASAIDGISGAKKPEEKKVKVEEFKEKFKEHLHLLIDPDHPDLGPKNNQFLWIHGRLKDGRGQFFQRFVKEGMGSANYHGHTTVCQGSLYFTGKAMSEKYGFDEKSKKVTWHSGVKFFWQADQNAAEFILFVGSSPFEANYPPLRTPNITMGLTSGRLKFAVADPRFSKTAAKAWKWLPIKPGMEAALGYGIIRWILDNEKFDKTYLANANLAAAKEDKEPTWGNGCWLVKMKDGKPGEFLRGSDLKLEKLKMKAKVKDEEVEYEYDPLIALVDGKPVPFVADDEKTAVNGDLFVDAELEGHQVKSALQLLKEEAGKHTLEEWSDLCGCPAEDVLAVAKEFSLHGKRAVACTHRGVSQHTNGFYNCMVFNALNLLLGNYDHKGGFVKASGYDHSGGKAKKPFDLSTMNKKKANPFGIGILREKKFEDTTLFEGKYPSKRPWFPNCTDVYQELLPSVGDAYPYPVKSLLLYMGTPGYAIPAGNTQIEVLADVNKLPLFVASDILVGESSMYADYIIPDLTFYERWEFQGSHPNNIWKSQPVRNPAIAPIPETVKVFGEEMPISLEAFMLAVAEKMKLPGFGPGAFGEAQDLKRPEDLYLRMVANIGFGEKEDGSDAVPEASDEELAIFAKARRHLPKSVFDIDKWKAAVGDNWKRVVYVMNRGGRFQEHDKCYDGKLVKNKYGRQVNLYCEKVAKTKNSLTGKSNPGYPKFLPIVDSVDNPVVHKPGDLHMITYREIFHTKSRTSGNRWLRELFPENFFLLNVKDARRLGFRTGDRVRCVSDSNPKGVWVLPNFGEKPMVGKVKASQGIRPGVVAFSLGHGHWAYGASDVTIDGVTVPGDKARGKGVHANAAMMLDPHLKNVGLQDLVGGSVCFYDSPVRLVRET